MEFADDWCGNNFLEQTKAEWTSHIHELQKDGGDCPSDGTSVSSDSDLDGSVKTMARGPVKTMAHGFQEVVAWQHPQEVAHGSAFVHGCSGMIQSNRLWPAGLQLHCVLMR